MPKQRQSTMPILAFGKGWIAVDKPSGKSVHNDEDGVCVVVSDELENHGELKAAIGYNKGIGLHPVHRLDRDTSGVLLLACDPTIFRFFSQQFERREVKKTYVAIVHGRLSPSTTRDGTGEWTWPLSAGPAGRNDPAGKKNRQHAATRFTVKDHSEHYTLIECFPLTGRIHQIRRHAKLAGHPVVGDHRYGSTRSVRYLETRCNFSRLGLHAMDITVNLKETGKRKRISGSGMPPDMKRLFYDDSIS